MATMERAQVEAWVAGYERAWRSAGTEALADLFTADATYLPSPWAAAVRGRSDLAAFWDDERDGPEEAFTMVHEVLAVDGDTATVRVAVDYLGPDRSRWRDLWVLRFDADGRCRAFEEWPFAPDQPDGHG
jgi:uncharacterized protein (TIGR02246 family)